MSRLKTMTKRKIRRLVITTGAAQAGTTGQPFSLELTVNLPVNVWTLLSGANFTLVDDTLSLINVSVAGDSVASVKAADAQGRINTKIITVTLSGAAGLGQVVGLNIPSTTPSTITMAFTDLAGATYYEAALDSDLNSPRTLGAPKTVGVSRPGNDYIVQVRGRDASGNAGAWSAEVTASVVDLVDPGPASVQQASRARDVTNAHVMQFSFQYSSNLYGYFYYGNSTGTLKDGTFVAGGWVKDHIEPLVNVGLKYYRTNTAGHNSATHLGSVLNRNLFSTYGLKLEATLNPYHTFQDVLISPPPATVTTVMANIRDATKGNYASSIKAFAGLNEPNYSGQDAMYTANGTNWKNEVIAHHIAMDAAITAGGASYSTVEHYCFSPWGRRDMDELVAHTDPLGRTWTTHAAPLIEKLNLHYYTGARRPEISGAPTGSDEGGTPLSEVSLDWTMDQYQQLAPVGTPLPFAMTEMGWGRLNGDTSEQYVSINTARKYNQRMLFENLSRNIMSTVYFQFFQTDLSMDWQLVDVAISGGVATFTRLSPYTTVLNTMTAFWDSGGTAESFSPGTLNFTLSADASAPNDYDQRIHHMLFQKSNLEFYLAIWYEKDSWNRTTKVETFGSRTVKLTLGSAKTVATNRPYTNTTFTSLGSITTTLLTVNDDVLVVRIV